RSLLKGFDIFVLPSRSEAMPYAPLEAGLAGVAVIATKVGGIPEIIKSEVNGLLVSPEDPIMLSSVLLLLASDKEMRKELGKNLKKTVEEEFSMDMMVEKTFYLYS
ncbi:MAG: glycosyltransferase family 4 protein, partial [Parcubacteria group bacterium]